MKISTCLVAFSFLTQCYAQSNVATSSKIVGILSSEPVTSHSAAGREVSQKETQLSVDGKNFWLVHSEGIAFLIDPDTLNATFTNQLIADLNVARVALEKRDANFSIVRQCPALLDMVLRTLDRNSAGLGDVVMTPQLSITLKKPDSEPQEFSITPFFEMPPSPIRLTASDVRAKGQNPLATPILTHRYAISYFDITQSTKRRKLEEEVIKTYWDLREDMASRYRQAYQNLAGKLSMPEQYNGLVGSWVGRSVASLQSDDRSVLSNFLSQHTQKIEEWQSADITRVTARLTLNYLTLTSDGESHRTSLRLPTGLY